jgi:hypothetical protein
VSSFSLAAVWPLILHNRTLLVFTPYHPLNHTSPVIFLSLFTLFFLFTLGSSLCTCRQ